MEKINENSNNLGPELNEVKPLVTFAIYVFQLFTMVTNFLVGVSRVLYKKFFKVRRLEKKDFPKISGRYVPQTRVNFQRQANNGSTSCPRPALPTDKSLAVQKLWNYMLVNDELKQSDVILLLGNYDARTYEYACQLWCNGWADYIMYTGTAEHEAIRLNQAEDFQRHTEAMLIPLSHVLLETDSTNILESLANSFNLLVKRGILTNSVILVHLPFMEKVVQLTFSKVWQDKKTKVTVASPPITLLNFPNAEVGTFEDISNDIVEAVEFILRFDEKARKELPDNLVEALQLLGRQEIETQVPHPVIKRKKSQKTIDPSKNVNGIVKHEATKNLRKVTKEIKSFTAEQEKLRNFTIRNQFKQFMDTKHAK